MMETEGEWVRVERRRNTKGRETRRVGQTNGEENVSFFFRNFPKFCTAEELRRRFGKLGRVEDIFIPEKKDKKGNMFGFVRFSNIVNQEEVLVGLNRIWIGSYIIRAYEPKYARKTLKAEERAKKKESTGDYISTPYRNRIWNRRVRGVTYLEVLNGKKNIAKGENQKKEGKYRADNDIHFQSTEIEGKWLRGACTGHLKRNSHGVSTGRKFRTKVGGA